MLDVSSRYTIIENTRNLLINLKSIMPTNFATVEDEYQKNPDLKKSDIQALQEWVQSQPHLPPISEFQLILFLQSCYSSSQLAKNTLDTFFTVKTHCPEFFSNRDISALPKDFFDVSVFTFLPQLTHDNYRVVYVKLVNQDVNKFNFNDQIKIFDMTMMLGLRQLGTQKGLLLLFDIDQLPFSFMTKFSLLGMKKFFYYLQEGMPVRLMGLHYVNVVPFMDKLLALMKPFMKQSLLDVLHLHETVDSLTEYVPKECLPKDLGGKADSISILHENMKKNFEENADFFRTEQLQLVDESKRPGKPKSADNIFGVEGSFKKLDID